MQRDQRIERHNIDLIFFDLSIDAVDQLGVDVELVVAFGDPQRHFIAAGHEKPADQLILLDLVILANRGHATFHFIKIVFAVVQPDPEPFGWLLAK
jgi:hypothetical protein